MFTRQRAPLRLIENEGGRIERLRLVKLAFLLSREADAPRTGVYDFVPYKCGPFSFTLYHDDEQVDQLRHYARHGTMGKEWPYSERSLYPPDFLFASETGGESYEVLHEWTFLYTPQTEMYLVIAILGIEYAINMGGPEIEGYELWLNQNPGKSPLYN